MSGDTPENNGRAQNIYDLSLSYLEYCQVYYRDLDGKTTNTTERIRGVLKHLTDQVGDLPPSDFTPLKLKEYQRRLIATGLARTTINHYVGEVKKFFRWCVSEEKIDPMTHHALTTVASLKPGRSLARETEPVGPVSQQNIYAIEPWISDTFWRLVCLQMLTGARGGEVINLRGLDINHEHEIWRVELSHHKTLYRGKKRVLLLGERAQEILSPVLATSSSWQYLFSPNDGKSPYGTKAYRSAIARACKRAGIPRWSPHRLRHTSATMVRERFGLEAAQVYLGHAGIATAQIYAEKNEQLAIDIAKEIG